MKTALIDLKTMALDDRGLEVTLSGELDFFTAEQVEPRLHELAGRPPEPDSGPVWTLLL